MIVVVVVCVHMICLPMIVVIVWTGGGVCAHDTSAHDRSGSVEWWGDVCT